MGSMESVVVKAFKQYMCAGFVAATTLLSMAVQADESAIREKLTTKLGLEVDVNAVWAFVCASLLCRCWFMRFSYYGDTMP